jgi:hypothetical protein
VIELAYTKFNWETNSLISAERLNSLETQYSEMVTLADHNHDDTHYTKTLADARYFSASHMGQGSGFDADLLDAKHASDIIGAGFPLGSILIWKGDLGTIRLEESIRGRCWRKL